MEGATKEQCSEYKLRASSTFAYVLHNLDMCVRRQPCYTCGGVYA